MNRRNFIKLGSLGSLLLKMNDLNALYKASQSFATTEKMPVLFLGHGSPMNAIEENEFVAGFRKVAKNLPKPKAILCISAHWFTRGTLVTAMEQPPTIHDFGGFPKELFAVQYPAKGSPELAKETKQLITATSVELDDKWGLDHGAWSVIIHLFPKADIPVIQLSIDYTKDPAWHFELAKQLNALRHKGVLIIGSGNLVHNLGLVDFQNMHKDDYGFDWAKEAKTTFNTHILNGNNDALIQYKKLSKAVQLAIPSPDHYLPLLYCLGLKDKTDKVELFNDKCVGGSLSMTSVKIS
jgi:4,5-DOPA dioxygenase extradiol